MSVQKTLIHDIPGSSAAPVLDLAIATQPRTASSASLFAVPDVVARMISDSHRAGRTLAGLAHRMIKRARPPQPAVSPSQPAEWLDTVLTAEVANNLRVTCGKLGDAVVVQASGEVDMHTAPGLAAALRAGCVTVRPPGTLVIDLTGIRFFSAAGLTLLLTTQQHCHEQQVALKVVTSHRSVVRLLRITGLDTVFDIAPTLEDATRPHRA